MTVCCNSASSEEIPSIKAHVLTQPCSKYNQLCVDTLTT